MHQRNPASENRAVTETAKREYLENTADNEQADPEESQEYTEPVNAEQQEALDNAMRQWSEKMGKSAENNVETVTDNERLSLPDNGVLPENLSDLQTDELMKRTSRQRTTRRKWKSRRKL